MSGSLRQPRLRVLANGAPLTGAIGASVSSNNYRGADRFQVSLAADTAAALIDADGVQIEVQFSLDAGMSFTSLITGAVDALDFDPQQGTLSLSGRDLTAGLIEARTQETFANQTSSEIATTLAGRHGLTAEVTATTTPVGRYWELEHDRIVLNSFARATAEWDLLVTLAQHEAFDVWVSGSTLCFHPPPANNAPQALLRPQDCISLRLERALSLAGDIEVIVKSWHSRLGAGCTQRAHRQGSGKTRSYVYVLPNLTPDQALTLAQQRLDELTRHERVLSVEMPGDLALTPRMALTLTGTGTAFDATYRIDEIERTLSVTHGFTQRLRARVTN